MEYAYYNTQTQPAFHQHQQEQFNGFPTPVSQYSQSIDTQPSQTSQDIYPDTNGYHQQYEPPTSAAAAAAAAAYQFNGNGSFIPAQPQQQPSPPLHLDSKEQTIQAIAAQNGTSTIRNDSLTNGDYTFETQEHDGNRSSSEEKDNLTPAQSRRKAQNRAAQRAFRERKERHVKDLETKLNSLSAHSNTLLTDNERLKRELQRLATQNEILRATSSHAAATGRSGSHPSSSPSARPPSPLAGPQIFSPIDFQAAVGEGHHPVSFEDFGGPEGHRLLAVGATWDLIMNHEAYRTGCVDIEAVHRRLKGRTLCNGRGPAFREDDVRRAIEDSIREGGEEMML